MGLAEFAWRENVGLLAYSPLAQGYLTGKYQNGAALPAPARPYSRAVNDTKRPARRERSTNILNLAENLVSIPRNSPSPL